TVHQLSLLNIEVRMYSPLSIKSAITGYGGADKKQIQEMVRILLGFEKIPKPDHAADALAAALCLAVFNATNMRMKTQ
ncbi:MAG: crossover junction endodeoxyribonuclease RuvC, partial [Sphaerochaeta sp.]